MDLGGVSSTRAHRCLKIRNCTALIKNSGAQYIISGQDVDTDVFTRVYRISSTWPDSANITYIQEFRFNYTEGPGLTNCNRLSIIKINGWYPRGSFEHLKYISSQDQLTYKQISCNGVADILIGLNIPQIVSSKMYSYSLQGIIRFKSDLPNNSIISICINDNEEMSNSKKLCTEYTMPIIPIGTASELAIPFYKPFRANKSTIPITVSAACNIAPNPSKLVSSNKTELTALAEIY